MRDPYDVLGIRRGAGFEEIRAAYRRACKTRHPDMGGSQQDFVELQAAYEAALTDLRKGFQAKREEAPQTDRTAPPRDERKWDSAYRDIDEELEELRRTARQREDALHAMRTQAWQDGSRVVWAKLTWQDISRFFAGNLRSGLKGVALLCAALIGLGSVLLEANAVSAIIMFGGGLGFVVSQALKSDKGGMLSAGLLLFGIMTIWMPSIRQALIHYPVATVSLLFCLALVFKFGQQGGLVGLLTGGVLTLYVIGVILAQTPQIMPGVQPPPGTADTTNPDLPPAERPSVPPQGPPPPPERRAELPPSPQVRELTASKGAILKFVFGVTYRLNGRAGFRTTLVATQGSFASFRGDDRITACTDAMDVAAPDGPTPYTMIEPALRSCGSDAIVRVIEVQ